MGPLGVRSPVRRALGLGLVRRRRASGGSGRALVLCRSSPPLSLSLRVQMKKENELGVGGVRGKAWGWILFPAVELNPMAYKLGVDGSFGPGVLTGTGLYILGEFC